jgi:hypothetical protein
MPTSQGIIFRGRIAHTRITLPSVLLSCRRLFASETLSPIDSRFTLADEGNEGFLHALSTIRDDPARCIRRLAAALLETGNVDSVIICESYQTRPSCLDI